jgi:hypothetical protein
MDRHLSSRMYQAVRDFSTSEAHANAAEILKKHYESSSCIPRFKGTSETALFNSNVSTMATSSEDRDPLPEDLSERLAPRQAHIVSSHALQRWDGYVLDIGPDSFRARLTDLTNPSVQSDAEEVEVSLEELDADSRARLAPGRLFQWSIGYELSRSGQKTRFSRIVVRQLPIWTPSELDQARAEGKELAQAIRWE